MHIETELRGYHSPVNIAHHRGHGLGDRMADRLTGLFGSWRFLGYMSAFIIVWILVNVIAVELRWDPYPFILLNLVFSTQASYAAPLILLAQNRSAERDRMQAEHDFACNQRAEAKIDLMLKQLGISQIDIDAINLEIDSLQPSEFVKSTHLQHYPHLTQERSHSCSIDHSG